LEGQAESGSPKKNAGFVSILIQIAILDIIFSLDSVITAVGLANHLEVMILAIVIAVGIMLISAKIVGDFVDTHPTIKMLALSFLILVGVSLIGEGFEMHIPKGYIYFSMVFSVGVEFLNMKIRKRTTSPIKLRKSLKQNS
jgi:predicted tellurium resistance membrane protein TerC